MNPRLHAAAGIGAMLCIGAFLCATIAAELAGSAAAIASVKRGILWCLLLLLPLMAGAGISGAILARGRTGALVRRKLLRMRFIAANGLCLLLPCAFILSSRANAGHFDILFYTVQLVELAAGILQLAMMVLNARDGMRLSRNGKHRPPPKEI